ncbi:DNA mismatch repair protein MutL [Armatimonadetes bacterium GXS]|nr:DNA mismatch repair protein MutL [bacterium HR14]CUU35621.1 DNA mismatch repair protein MutL [Armatimonadetes bacterium GXS]
MRQRPERRPVQPLDETVVNRIAAGEVVERPASAVKELVENALDAGATRIEVEVEMGGRKLIRVRDDGIGMTRDDALRALERHATSKIASDADLLQIQTLGFRGEALPSIASVSKLELITRAFEEPIGTRIVVEGGEVRTVEEVGAPIGTTVTVRDLFYNVPARLKFLKTVATELGHIVETMTRYSFAYPDVSFRLIHERQELLFTPGTGDLLAAVASVWGREMVRGMVSVDWTHEGVRVRGLIAPPHHTRPTRQHQYFYVNLRPVRNKTLTAALDEAYKSLTPEKRYPACVLLVDINPRLVDVNVHPAKIEVRFQKEHVVFEAVYEAIRRSLLEHGMTPSALPPQREVSPVPAPAPAPMETESPPDAETLHRILLQRAGLPDAPPAPEPAPPAEPHPDPFRGRVRPRPVAPPSPEPAESPQPSLLEPATSPVTEPPPQTAHLPFAHLLDDLQILGQVQNTFIVASTRHGLVIIDQHVAHERVLYEQFLQGRGATPVPVQRLLTPEPLTLSRRDAILLQEKLPELQAIGFEMEPFGADSFLVRGVPAALKNRDPIQTLRDIVDELVELSVSKRLPVAREQVWITTACKLAVKAGDPLSMPEMQKLIEDLAKTENPYLCPHGRPITLTISWGELERRFKRS